MQYIGGGGSGCTMAVAVAAADKLSGATLPPSGNTLPLRGLKMAVAEAVAAAVSLSATVVLSSVKSRSPATAIKVSKSCHYSRTKL